MLGLTGARDYVPAVQDPRLRSFLPPAGPRLLLGIHDTAPQNTPLAAPLNLTDATDYGAVANAQELTSYLVPTRPDAAIDTTPQDGWRFSAIPTYPPAADLLRSYLPTGRPDAAIDTVPSQAWIFSAVPVVTTPTYPPGVDQVRNSYLPPAGARLLLGVHDTAPAFSWLQAVPLFNAPTGVASRDALRNSYLVPARAVLDVRDTRPQDAPLRTALVLYDATRIAPITDARRNSYRLDDRPRWVPDTVLATGWIYAALPTVPTYPPGVDALRNAYVAPARASRAIDTAPSLAWIFKALPSGPPPTYPPGALVARNSYAPPSRAAFLLGTHDLTAEPAWIEYGAAHPYVPPPPPQALGYEAPRLKPTLLGAPIPKIVRRGSPLPWSLQKYWDPSSRNKK